MSYTLQLKFKDINFNTEYPKSQLLRVYFQDQGLSKKTINEIPTWAYRDFIHIDYGYALTCHKAQGSEWDSILIFHEPIGRGVEERLRWTYTALTRSKHKAVLVYF